jgi:hypothetical protein
MGAEIIKVEISDGVGAATAPSSSLIRCEGHKNGFY